MEESTGENGAQGGMEMVSTELLRMLRPLADQAGIDLPNVTMLVPRINLTGQVRDIARTLGGLCTRQLIFRTGIGRQVVTINEVTGEKLEMTADRFCSWVEEFATTFKPAAHGDKPMTMGKDLASKLLANDFFMSAIRPLTAVEMVRLPIRREDGTVELLPAGYDESTGIFTLDSLGYDLNWSVPQAEEWLEFLLKEWPWADNPGYLCDCRSASVHVAGMVGTYIRHWFAPGTPRPMMTYLGNQPGTGKSTLVAMNLSAVNGPVFAATKPKNEEKFEALLETEAATFSPYLWLDDIGHGIFSPALNRFISAPGHTARVYGKNTEKFTVPNVTQVFVTGNAIELTKDLMRRSLVIELHLAGEVQGREFQQEIDDAYLRRPEIRAKTLSALWALVRAWVDDGQKTYVSGLKSFTQYTSITGSIMMANHWCDPTQAPELPIGGDQEEREWRQLLISIANRVETAQDITREEMVEEARRLQLLEDLVGNVGDGDIKADAAKRFGRRLQKWRGRELYDDRGRQFRFGLRKQERRNVYPCEIIGTKA